MSRTRVIADPHLPAPVRSLPQYDNVFLSHDDRSRIEGAMSWGIDFGWRGPILVTGPSPPRGGSCDDEDGDDDDRPRPAGFEGGACRSHAEATTSVFLDPGRVRAIVIATPG